MFAVLNRWLCQHLGNGPGQDTSLTFTTPLDDHKAHTVSTRLKLGGL